ncbi:TPA: MFS transporter [Serratia fonticola]|jgi:MFS family permease|uniref:D-galactonate transporter n=1 Tax=Serratia fonticola TaxID=47917 RepID=A0A0F7HDN6_SERFO|nr:MFS transporter [Serratia fonticola]AKG70251.1 MFS transporter [Serratia fonticola]NTY89867.1 MFS transporter [Serratia fonticola]NTZ15675.1 MFS transporter [Serratia fonticola]CAI0784731.1 D-galactonate transporter [Serratia fonticola]CAI0785802.1 D-galactonate transporter [Serratia fonticola]
MSNSKASSNTGFDPLYWKKIVVVLCLGWAVIWIYRTVLTPIFPEIQATIGSHSNAEMGLIASFYFFAYTGMQIPAGILVDKFGKKVVLIPGFCLFIIATLLIGNATSLTMIYAGSLLAGMGCGSYYGSAYSLSSENIPLERRGLATAIINSGSALGMAIGLIASSLLVKSMGMDWQIMLFIITGLLVVMTVVFFLVIKGGSYTASLAASPAASAATPVEETEEASGLFSLRMISAYVMYFATCYGYYMIVTWLPSFLQQERGFEGVAIGFSAALVAFASVPGALFFSRMSDRFRAKKVQLIIFLQICAAVTLVCTVISPDSTTLLVSLILYGLLGKLAVDPIMISFVADNAPKKGYGTSFGVFNFFGMSSSVIAPFLTGVISDSTGSKVMGFYISAAILLIGTVIFFTVNVLMKQKNNRQTAAQA